MTPTEFFEKYGSEPDCDTVDAYDLYNLLNDNRPTLQALFDQEKLHKHWLYEPVRRRTITDLFFLNLFLWDANPFGGPEAPISENQMTIDNCKNVIDMFVKKDPEKSIAQQSKIKTRLILYPRGSMKSSWGIFDVVQWVLLDPKIRILVLSAADDLASEIVNEIRGYFKIREETPTLLNMFWPENCLLEKDFGSTGEYTSPAWSRQQIARREPTIMSRGVTSSVSGFHFELFHGDDTVETRNSGSEEQCISVRKKYGITRKVLRTFGYVNLLGTRYHEADLYGDMIAKSELGEYHTHEFSIGEKKTTNLDKGVEILVGAGMTLKPDAEVELAKYNYPRETWFRKAGPEGVVLLMPNILKYDTLLVDYENDPEAHETQMRQNVTPPTSQKFTREMILKNTVNWDQLPLYGRVTHTWDLNGGKGKKDNDFCVGSACLWDSKGVGHIIDILHENYPNPVSIARAIVEFAMKHHPEIISIEDSQGIRMLAPTLEREADATRDDYVKGLVRRIYWRPVDTSKDAKKNRINNLFPLIMYGRLKFSATLAQREKMIEQFIRPVTKSSKNDIPDCISFQTAFLPPIPTSEQDRKRIEEEMKARRTQEMARSTWEMLFTEGRGIQYRPQIYETPAEEIFSNPNPYESDGLDNILGFGLIG